MQTNKFLVFLLVIALVLSVVEVGYIINRLSKTAMTGFATADTGFVNITIETNVSVTATTDTVNFGSGYLEATKDYAILKTEDGTTVPDNWTNTSVYSPSDLVLENDGNTNITLNFSSDKAAATFIGGNGPYFKYASANKDAGACLSGLVASYTDVIASTQWVCTNLGASTDYDEVYVNISIKVPTGVTAEAKAATFTFTAAAA